MFIKSLIGCSQEQSRRGFSRYLRCILQRLPYLENSVDGDLQLDLIERFLQRLSGNGGRLRSASPAKVIQKGVNSRLKFVIYLLLLTFLYMLYNTFDTSTIHFFYSSFQHVKWGAVQSIPWHRQYYILFFSFFISIKLIVSLFGLVLFTEFFYFELCSKVLSESLLAATE